MNNKYSAKAVSVLNGSKKIAAEMGHRHIGTEHLLLALTYEKDSVACRLLRSRNINEKNIVISIKEIFPVSNSKSDMVDVTMSPRLIRVIQIAAREAIRTKSEIIGTEHLLLAILLEGEGIAVHILDVLGAVPQELLSDIIEIFETSEDNFYEESDEDFAFDLRENTSLNNFGREMTELARAEIYDPVIGREKQIKRIIQILARRTKNNPVILGDPGVGKTAIVEGIAQQISKEECPDIIKGKKIFSLDVASLVAGAKYRGEFEDRLKRALEEIIRNNDTILFIDEIHTIVGAGNAEGAIDASSIIKPYLSRGEIQVIGATSVMEYRKYIEKDIALERRLQTVYISEPSVEETLSILKGIKYKYEKHHSVILPDETLLEAIDLSVRYISDRRLPDKAIDLIDEASAMVRLNKRDGIDKTNGYWSEIEEFKDQKNQAMINKDFKLVREIYKKEDEFKDYIEEKINESYVERSSPVVCKDDIAKVVSLWTGIPAERVSVEDTKKLMDLEKDLKGRIIGQDKAVMALSRAIKRNKVGLRDPNRPVGSFIFLGPTGVGKTELAKVLAKSLFDNENEMIRLDMSEYMGKHSVSKLIGSPPGYIGYDEAGQLTEKIKRKPYSIVLFDEIEKAHPDIFNILLQILEDGILTDSHGQKVDFKNTVIIMTSNVGAKKITDHRSLGFEITEDTDDNYEDMKRSVLDELKKTFRPEFLNRVDDVIVFRALESHDIEQIAQLMLMEISKRVSQNNIEISFDENVKCYFAKKGYDPKFGARPLRRIITEILENKVAEEILSGQLSKDNRILAFINEDDEIAFKQI